MEPPFITTVCITVSHENIAVLFYAVPGLYVAVIALSVPFMLCPDVFMACPAVMLLTLIPKSWRLPLLRGSDQVKLGLFSTALFAFKYGWFVTMACCGVHGTCVWQDGKFFPDRTEIV